MNIDLIISSLCFIGAFVMFLALLSDAEDEKARMNKTRYK